MITAFKDISLLGVKGVLLDLDDTLYDYKSNHERAINFCKKICNTEYNISIEEFDENFKTARHLVNESLHGTASSHSRLLYFQKMHEIIFGRTNVEFSLRMEEHYWNELMKEMKLSEEGDAFIAQLITNGIKSCIVTDLTCQIQMRKLIKLGLQQSINFLVTSEEAGVEKPSGKIFELALSKLKLLPSEVIMIGDNPEKDIKGAKEMGIKNYLIKI